MTYLFVFIREILHLIQPVLGPLCLSVAWTLVLLLLLGGWAAIRDGVSNVKRMHEIPCANCRFFTHNYLLKCPVNPKGALSEQAIGCPDYDPDYDAVSGNSHLSGNSPQDR